MKPNIHPTYYHNVKVICACGNTFMTGSIAPEIHVDICSKCHPFFTGVKKYIDVEGRVERFERKRQEAAAKTKPSLKKGRAAHILNTPAKSLKQMLSEAKG